MGVPGRGGRRESWAPTDVGSGSSHLASVYSVPISTRAAPRAAVASRSVRRFLTVRTCVLGPI